MQFDARCAGCQKPKHWTKGFSERCEKWLHTLSSWVHDSVTHPGMQLSQRRSSAGSQLSILRSAKSGMRVKWGHSSWEKTSMFLVHGVEVLGQCSDGDMVARSKVTAQFQDPLLPSFLLFLISWTRGNFRLVCPAWQRRLGQRLGIAASCDCDTDTGDRNKNQLRLCWKHFFFKLFVVEIKLNYNVVSITAIHQSNSVIHIHICVCVYIYIYIYTHIHTSFFIFFSIMVYHRILNIVPCAVQ